MVAAAKKSILENEDLLDQIVKDLLTLIKEGSIELAATRIELFHPADQAEVLESLPEIPRNILLRHLGEEDLADILEFLDEEPRERFVQRLEPVKLASILLHMEDEVAADIVGALPKAQGHAVLAKLQNREAVSELLSLPEDCVARWMSSDVLALQVSWTVEQAFEFLRSEQPETGEHFYLYTVDEDNRLKGVVGIRDFITAKPEQRLEDIMEKDVMCVDLKADQEAAGEKLRHYGLIALPVIDSKGCLAGILRADDVLDVQVEEATEDIFLQVGLDAEASAFSPIREAIMSRTPWLFVNLVIGFFSALIVSFFQDTIDRVAVLAAFMPIIAGHGGNTGCQTTTLVVRGIALGEISRRDLKVVLAKEMTFGLVYGVLAGTLSGLLAYALTHNTTMSGIVFVAMLGNIVLATLGGALIPQILRAVGVDPALASTVWLTTFTDWIGFFLLLGLGSVYVERLQVLH
jgi:magnesium transporter